MGSKVGISQLKSPRSGDILGMGRVDMFVQVADSAKVSNKMRLYVHSPPLPTVHREPRSRVSPSFQSSTAEFMQGRSKYRHPPPPPGGTGERARVRKPADGVAFPNAGVPRFITTTAHSFVGTSNDV